MLLTTMKSRKADLARIALALLFATGCAAWDGDPSKCDYVARGACFRGGSGAPKAEAERIIAISAGYWGAPLDVLEGYLVETRYTSAIKCWGDSAQGGCADLLTYRIDLVYAGPNCPLYDLPHEIGHVAIGGDMEHLDPRWQWIDALAADICRSRLGAP